MSSAGRLRQEKESALCTWGTRIDLGFLYIRVYKNVHVMVKAIAPPKNKKKRRKQHTMLELASGCHHGSKARRAAAARAAARTWAALIRARSRSTAVSVWDFTFFPAADDSDDGRLPFFEAGPDFTER